MNESAVDVPPHVLDYIGGQKTLTLATSSPTGVPRASTFLYVNDGPVLYFWTKPNTVTARHVAQNPVVSFAIDEYSDDLRDTRGVQGLGECSVLLSGLEIARVADLFGQKFPKLSPGQTMSISFFRIAPSDLHYIDNRSTSPGRAKGEFGADFHRERAYSVFSDLPVLNVDTIAASLEAVTFAAGDVVVRQGGPADKFFIVVDGAVEVVRDVDGKEETVASFGPGDFFGEMAIMRDSSRSASVRATEATKLLSLDRSSFRDLVAQSLGTTTDFDNVIQARLRSLGQSS
jgi:uncharacterized protein YhbP (UPF0306 family)